jgi:type IV pilus assembly protein PilV
MRPVSACAGFTLIEVLVALFVVALGFAGVAGVQAMALRSGREAAHLADGLQLAASLAELAQFDLMEVTSDLAARFPGGRILACRDAAGASSWTCDAQPGAPIVIKLGWREHGETATPPRVLLPVAGGGA